MWENSLEIGFLANYLIIHYFSLSLKPFSPDTLSAELSLIRTEWVVVGNVTSFHFLPNLNVLIVHHVPTWLIHHLELVTLVTGQLSNTAPLHSLSLSVYLWTSYLAIFSQYFINLQLALCTSHLGRSSLSGLLYRRLHTYSMHYRSTGSYMPPPPCSSCLC